MNAGVQRIEQLANFAHATVAMTRLIETAQFRAQPA